MRTIKVFETAGELFDYYMTRSVEGNLKIVFDGNHVVKLEGELSSSVQLDETISQTDIVCEALKRLNFDFYWT